MPAILWILWAIVGFVVLASLVIWIGRAYEDRVSERTMGRLYLLVFGSWGVIVIAILTHVAMRGE